MVKYFPVALLKAYEEEARKRGIQTEELLARAFDGRSSLCTNKAIWRKKEMHISLMCAYLSCDECLAHSSGREDIIEALENGELEIKPYTVGDK